MLASLAFILPGVMVNFSLSFLIFLPGSPYKKNVQPKTTKNLNFNCPNSQWGEDKQMISNGKQKKYSSNLTQTDYNYTTGSKKFQQVSEFIKISTLGDKSRVKIMSTHCVNIGIHL